MVSEKAATAAAGSIAVQIEAMKIAARAVTGKQTKDAATALTAAAIGPALRTSKETRSALGQDRCAEAEGRRCASVQDRAARGIHHLSTSRGQRSNGNLGEDVSVVVLVRGVESEDSTLRVVNCLRLSRFRRRAVAGVVFVLCVFLIAS